MAGHRSSVPSADSGRVHVPRLNQDPVWSLKPWPAVVTIAHQDFEIPAMPAADWLAVLMKPELSLDEFLFELIPDSEDLLLATQASLDDLYTACLDLISLVSARHWWVTMRLISVARESWDILGAELALRNANAAQLSLSAWLDVLLLVTLRQMDPKDVTMFTMRLEAVPEEESVPQEEMEMSANAFLAMGR